MFADESCSPNDKNSRIYHMEEQMKQTHGDDWKASMKIKIEVKGDFRVILRSKQVIPGHPRSKKSF